MSAPVIQFKTIEKVDTIYRTLSVESHHGFPVVDHHSDEVESKMFFVNICRWFLYIFKGKLWNSWYISRHYSSSSIDNNTK